MWGGGNEAEERETGYFFAKYGNEMRFTSGNSRGVKSEWSYRSRRKLEELALSEERKASSLKEEIGLDAMIILEEKWDFLNPRKE